jgi:hypothetical protein
MKTVMMIHSYSTKIFDSGNPSCHRVLDVIDKLILSGLPSWRIWDAYFRLERKECHLIYAKILKSTMHRHHKETTLASRGGQWHQDAYNRSIFLGEDRRSLHPRRWWDILNWSCAGTPVRCIMCSLWLELLAAWCASIDLMPINRATAVIFWYILWGTSPLRSLHFAIEPPTPWSVSFNAAATPPAAWR